MAEKPQNSPELKSLESQLDKQRTEKIAEFKKTLYDRLDIYMKTHERVEGEENAQIRDYVKRSGQLTYAIKEMARDYEAEKGELDAKLFLDKQAEKLNTLKSLADLALQIADESGKKDKKQLKISTFEEFANFNALKAVIDKDMENVVSNGFSEAEKVDISYLQVMGKLKDGITFDELPKEEAQIVLAEVRKVSLMPPIKPNELYTSMHRYPGLLFMNYLNPKDRLNVMKTLLDDKHSLKTIISLTSTNYLSVEQGEELIKILAQNVPDAAPDCLKAMELIGSEKFRAYKLEFEKMKKKAGQALERNLGKNYAGKIGSANGLLVWYGGRIFGVASMALAFATTVDITNIMHPSKWGQLAGEVGEAMVNPGFILGAGVLGLSVETISGGLGRGFLTKTLGKLLKDKSETPEAKREKKTELMKAVITDWRNVSKFYYQNAEKIVDKISLKKNPQDVTLQNLGIAFSTLDPELQKEAKSEATLNKILQELAVSLYDAEMGIGILTHDQQQRFINGARDSRGLTQFS